MSAVKAKPTNREMSAVKGKYTKGPWKSIGREIWVGGELLCRSEPEESPNPNHDNIANAHLIAAAPELLEACQLLLRTHVPWAGPTEQSEQKARAAIAKALKI